MKSTPILVDRHGYVKAVDAWGTGEAGSPDPHPDAMEDWDFECGIIEAARQSTQGSFRGWEEDGKLLKHLFTSKPQHAGPFEFAGLVIEVQAPIFVFREWHRHRTQSYNEMSARYAPLPDLYFVPEADDVMERAHRETRNKQAQGLPGTDLSMINCDDWIDALEAFYASAENLYQYALKVGVPKELARVSMPVGHYSRMRASANLRNWLAFATLRMDPNAQTEIRRYANAVGTIIQSYFPRTWLLFNPENRKSDQ